MFIDIFVGKTVGFLMITTAKPIENQMFHVEHKPFGAYVHVPFCVSKCGYCDFCRVTELGLVCGYLKTLEKEIEESEIKGRQPRTIYVGGGTPSCIGKENVSKLLGIVGKSFDLRKVEEFTVECNPDDVDRELCEIMVENGVDRVSMGVQSMNEKMLKLMGRRHSVEQVGNAVACLREAGIKNISLDFIYGLPVMESYDFERDIERFLELDVEHCSAYSLSYEEGSIFTKMVEEGRLTAMEDDEVAEQYEILTAKMRERGFEHYEISNYARKGKRSRHNSSYWNKTPYYGFGPGASSYDGKVRTTNVMDVRQYIRSGGREKSLVEKLTSLDEYEEAVMLRLRTIEGVGVEELPEEYREEFIEKARVEMKNGNLAEKEGRYFIPEKKWFVADGIIERLV